MKWVFLIKCQKCFIQVYMQVKWHFIIYIHDFHSVERLLSKSQYIIHLYIQYKTAAFVRARSWIIDGHISYHQLFHTLQNWLDKILLTGFEGNMCFVKHSIKLFPGVIGKKREGVIVLRFDKVQWTTPCQL